MKSLLYALVFSFLFLIVGNKGAGQEKPVPRAFDFLLPDGGLVLRTDWLSSPPNTDSEQAAMELLELGVSDQFANAEQNARELFEKTNTKGKTVNVEEFGAALLIASAVVIESEDMIFAAQLLRLTEKMRSDEQTAMPLLGACISYFAAAAQSGKNDGLGVECSKRSYEFFRSLRHDFPTEYVFCGSQFACFCSMRKNGDEAKRIVSELDEFVSSRKQKLGLAFAHLCWARAVVLERNNEWAAALQSIQEGAEVVGQLAGKKSLSAVRFNTFARDVKDRQERAGALDSDDDVVVDPAN